MLRSVDASIVAPRVDGPHAPDGDDVRDGESEGGRRLRRRTSAQTRAGGRRGCQPPRDRAAAARAARPAVLAARPRPRSRAQPASAMSRRCTQRPAAYVR
ncbi:hypothetical protein AQ859_21065 [Burkholderia pseudomallei]|nr:hypothetical protein AQ760_19975 [Burkholderia pseudomallei]OMZ29348.1 hypothetical protein AQ859_21065 [Burkholderia pseudomallei]